MYGFTHAHSCDVFVKIICISVSHPGFNCLENQCLNLHLHKASTQCVTFPVLSKYLEKKELHALQSQRVLGTQKKTYSKQTSLLASPLKTDQSL